MFRNSAIAGGVRTTAAALAPLIVGHAMGQTPVGSIVAIGALNVSLTDIGGVYRSKARAMAVATFGVAAAAFIGTLAGQTPWAAVPTAFLIAAAGGLAGVFGNAANKISFSILAVFVITLGLPGGIAVALQWFVACLAGGLLGGTARRVVLRSPSGSGRLTRSSRPARRWPPTTGPCATSSPRSGSATKRGAPRRGAVEPIDELVTCNRHFFDGVTALTAHLPALRDSDPPRESPALPGLRRLAEQIASLLESVGEAVRAGACPEPMPSLEKSVQVVQAAARKLMAARVAELAARGEGGSHPPADSPKRQAVLDFTPVADGLRRLAQDAAGMHRVQSRVSC